MNDETQSYESQASEVVPEILNSMADGSPDDQNQALSEQDVNELERLPAIIPMQSPVFHWGEVEGEEFVQVIEGCYEEVVHWKRNLFKVPSGRAGKSFVRELTRMFQAYADASALESMALQAAMVMPALLLQKPHAKSKAKEHTILLDRRLKQWADGDIEGLLREGRTIQHRLKSQHNQDQRSSDHTARVFAKLIMEGKVRAALRVISENNGGGLLNLESPAAPNSTETVREALLKKHPPGKPLTQSAIVTMDNSIDEPHPVLFDRIDGDLIQSTALKTEGAAGPSGLDAAAWRRLCTSFKSSSAELCDALAAVGRRICTTYVDPSGLRPFVASRLIALDKCPGVRPIGIGEVARRIIGKAIVKTISSEIQEATGPLQTCAGHLSGCEAAVHAMHQVFEDAEAEGVILVDATNAFNCLNRQVALLNVKNLCPALSKVLINTYRQHSQLFIDGESILSQEGTTQGDPLAMAMYAVAITPLIHRLSDENTKQVWFADDASAGGKLDHIKNWWDNISQIGPEYGYYPKASKTWLIVKEQDYERAESLFQDTGVVVTHDGKRHLGSAIGSHSFVENYVEEKVTEWKREVERLSEIAMTQPQAAYAALTHGLVSKWTYLARTTPNIDTLLKPLEEVIRHKLLPAITGQKAFSDNLRDLMALPAHLGGLGIINPSHKSTTYYSNSSSITTPLVDLITQQSKTLPPETRNAQIRAKNLTRTTRRQREKAEASEITNKLPSNLKKAVEVSSEKGASTWLTTLPIADHGFALHKGAFRDALCLRYSWCPEQLPSRCVCDQKFTVEHALSCSRGGFPSIRHNEVRDITAEFLTEICHGVGTEPCLQPVTDERLTQRSANREEGARLDIVAENFWGRDQQRAFFDVRVFNPFAPSYRNTSLAQCYRKNELEKRRAYDERIREIEHGSFSPLVFSAAGGMGETAKVVYKRIASLIADKYNKPYSKTINWLRCRLSFSLLRSAVMCLRGSRSSLHHPISSSCGEIDLAIAEGQGSF